MTFTVTYRNKNGQKVHEAFEADSRSQLFEQLRTRKINALKVDNGNTVTRTSAAKTLSSKTKALIATIFVIAVGVVALYLFYPTKDVPQVTQKDAPQKRNPTPHKISTNVVKKADKQVATPKEEKPAVVTNFVNNVWYDEKGRPHYKVARSIRPGQRTIINGKPWIPEKPVFHHPVEVELDVLLSRRPGERIFGDVNWKAFERDLPAALSSKIEILPDDTDDIIERKKLVAAAKKELIEAMKAGESPTEILKASRDDINRLADMRDNLQSTIAEMRQEGASEDEIEDAVKAANMLLQEKNIDYPIISPKTMRERGEAAKLRKLQRMQERQR
jgi:hypothetical protein